MTVHYEERSKNSRDGVILVSVFILTALAAIIYSAYRSIVFGHLLGAELLIEFIIFIVLLIQALGRYRYLVTDDRLIIEERNFYGKKTMEIPYKMIDGVYPFRNKLMSPMKFRYKYRKVASADARPVWALAYGIEGGKKLVHGRVIIKGDDAFFEALGKYVDRVKSTEEDVLFYAYIREDAYKHGEDPDEYLAKIKAQQAENEKAQAEKNTIEASGETTTRARERQAEQAEVEAIEAIEEKVEETNKK